MLIHQSHSFRYFLLVYILLLRSCVYELFYHLVLHLFLLEKLYVVWPLCYPGITQYHRYYGPIRHLLVFHPLRRSTTYRMYLTPGYFFLGPGRLLQFLGMSYVIMSSLPPRWNDITYQSYFVISCCIRFRAKSSASKANHFRGYL